MRFVRNITQPDFQWPKFYTTKKRKSRLFSPTVVTFVTNLNVLQYICQDLVLLKSVLHEIGLHSFENFSLKVKSDKYRVLFRWNQLLVNGLPQKGHSRFAFSISSVRNPYK